MLETYQEAQRILFSQGVNSSVMVGTTCPTLYIFIGGCQVVDLWNRDVEFIAKHGVKFASHYQAVAT